MSTKSKLFVQQQIFLRISSYVQLHVLLNGAVLMATLSCGERNEQVHEEPQEHGQDGHGGQPMHSLVGCLVGCPEKIKVLKIFTES